MRKDGTGEEHADEVVPLSSDDIPALESLVEALLDENQRLHWEGMVAKAKMGELTPPEKIVTNEDATTWLAWAKANLHQDGCQCHRCMASRRQLSADNRG